MIKRQKNVAFAESRRATHFVVIMSMCIQIPLRVLFGGCFHDLCFMPGSYASENEVKYPLQERPVRKHDNDSVMLKNKGGGFYWRGASIRENTVH